jgi:hypothetical protein
MTTRNWHGLNKVRRAREEKLLSDPHFASRPSLLPERATDHGPPTECTDSLGQPISLPKVSILERKE